MLTSIIVLFCSIFILVAVSNLIVDILTKLSVDFNISLVVVSIVIVGFGSSLPEFVVSFSLSSNEETVLSIGNIIGSNMFNMLFVIGVASILCPIAKYNIDNFNIVFLLLSAIFVVALTALKQLSLALGLAMLGAIALYVTVLVFKSHNCHNKTAVTKFSPKQNLIRFAFITLSFLILTYSMFGLSEKAVSFANNMLVNQFSEIHKSFILGAYSVTTLGVAGLIYYITSKKEHTFLYLFGYSTALALLFITLINSSSLIYTSSAELAHIFKVPEKIIAFLLLAVGTSLPELSFAVISSIKKHSEIVIGNIVGSNIFNALFVLGFVNVLEKSEIPAFLFTDSLVVLFATIALAFIMFTHKVFTKLLGVSFVAIYVFYLTVFVV